MSATPIIGGMRGPTGPGGAAGTNGANGYCTLGAFTQPAALATVANVTYAGPDPGVGAYLDVVVGGAVAGRYLVTAQAGGRVTLQALSLGTVAEGASVGASVALHAGASGPLILGAFTQPAATATVSSVTFAGPALPAGTSIIVVAGTILVGFYTIFSAGATLALTLDYYDTITPTTGVSAGAVVYAAVNQASRILYGGTGDWNGSPSDVDGALDRLAAAVAGLLVGPIP